MRDRHGEGRKDAEGVGECDGTNIVKNPELVRSWTRLGIGRGIADRVVLLRFSDLGKTGACGLNIPSLSPDQK